MTLASTLRILAAGLALAIFSTMAAIAALAIEGALVYGIALIWDKP